MPPPLPAPPPVSLPRMLAQRGVSAAAREPAEEVTEPAAATAARCLLESDRRARSFAVPFAVGQVQHYENATAVMSISSTSRLRQKSPPVSER